MNRDLDRALAALASEHLNASDLAAALDINHRYARELLGLAAHYGWAEEAESDWETGAYQITTRGRAALDSESQVWFTGSVRGDHRERGGHKMATKTRASTEIEFRGCACGCGQTVAGKSIFRQGHDAKMVSQLTSAVVGHGKAEAVVPPQFSGEAEATVTSTEDIQHRINVATAEVERLFGARLAAKAHSALMNGWANYDKPKRARGKGKVDGKAIEVVKAKVGRWEREGFVDSKGTFKYKDAKGETKTAAKGKYTLVA